MKKLRKILNSIKQLFCEAGQQPREQAEEIETPNQKLEKNLKLKDFVPELNEVDEEALFASIIPGDIIYAVTYPSAKELVKMEPQHRIRPYIVASRTENKLIAYCGTSNMKRKYKHSFTLSKERYDVFKSGNDEYWSRIYRIKNQHDYSDQKTNFITEKKDAIFKILINEGVDELKDYLSSANDQLTLF